MFLAFNGYAVIAPQDKVEETCVAIAAGNPAPEVALLAGWLRRNTVTVDKLTRLLRVAEARPDYWQLGIAAPDGLTNAAN